LPGKVACGFEDVQATTGGVDRHQNAAHPGLELGDKETGTPVPPGDGIRRISQQEPHEMGVMLASEHHEIGTVLVGVAANLNAGKAVCHTQSNPIDFRCPKYVGFEPPAQVRDLLILTSASTPAGSLRDTRESGRPLEGDHANDAELGRTPRCERSTRTHGLTAGVRFVGRSEDMSQEHSASPE
jgi:hypothetical protein